MLKRSERKVAEPHREVGIAIRIALECLSSASLHKAFFSPEAGELFEVVVVSILCGFVVAQFGERGCRCGGIIIVNP